VRATLPILEIRAPPFATTQRARRMASAIITVLACVIVVIILVIVRYFARQKLQLSREHQYAKQRHNHVLPVCST
jgi:hypothetical protein